MNKLNQQTNRYLLLGLLLLVAFWGLVVKKGPSAIRGILWGFSFRKPVGLFRNSLVSKKVINLSSLKINFGAYDPEGDFRSRDNLAIDHYFINWNDQEIISDLARVFKNSADSGRWVLLTVEPWPVEDNLKENLLLDITNGDYDQQIGQVCSQIGISANPVLVRWGHEMENITGRYPWAVDRADSYIAAYNYFVSSCKKITDNAYYVWSPVGGKGLDAYWPGKENVDTIGLSVYLLPEFERDLYGTVRDFSNVFGEKYERVEKYGKPVMIAEMGVAKEYAGRQDWWLDALNSVDNYYWLKTIVYFNAKEHEGVWLDYQTPDWTFFAFPALGSLK